MKDDLCSDSNHERDQPASSRKMSQQAKENEEALRILDEAAGIMRAIEYYESQGGTVIERNWTSQNGRVELIVESDSSLRFVRIRMISDLGENDDLEMTDEQEDQLERMAGDYTSQHNIDMQISYGNILIYVNATKPMILIQTNL